MRRIAKTYIMRLGDPDEKRNKIEQLIRNFQNGDPRLEFAALLDEILIHLYFQ
jgi:hypothetical protein